MDERWDVRPFAGDLPLDEARVEDNARIAFDTDEDAVGAAVEDHGMDDPTIGLDGVAEFIKAGTALALIVAGRAERQVELLWRRVVGVHFKELPDPRICAIKLDVGNRDHLKNATRDHKYLLRSHYKSRHLNELRENWRGPLRLWCLLA